MNEGHWTLLGVVIGGLLSLISSWVVQSRRFKHEKEMFLLENKSKEEVKETISNLLFHKNHVARSFSTIKKRVGGFSEDEIRRMLHELGTITYRRKSDDVEMWYLKERKTEFLEKYGD